MSPDDLHVDASLVLDEEPDEPDDEPEDEDPDAEEVEAEDEEVEESEPSDLAVATESSLQ